MRVGVVTEINPDELRVALTPAGTRALHQPGHHVVVQAGAAVGAGFRAEDHRAAGAQPHADPEAIWRDSELLLKVKEPIASEHRLAHADRILFADLQLAADRALTEALIAAGTTAVAYETVADAEARRGVVAPKRPPSRAAWAPRSSLSNVRSSASAGSRPSSAAACRCS